MADRKISELTVIEASGVSSGDLFLIVDINETDVNQKSKSFTASGLASYVFSRLSEAGAGERFYVDETNSTQRGFFGTLGVDTISGNTLDGGSRINIAEGVSVYIANFQNQNLIVQSEDAPTDSGTIFWYRPPISGLLGRTYYRYINPTGVGPSAVEWVESAPFETATIEIGTQQVISGIFNPLRIPAATNSTSGYGGIQFTDEDGKFLNASGVYVFIPITTSGIVGGVPTISGIEEGLPLVKKGDTLAYVSLSGAVINADFSNQQLRVAQGTASAPSYTFTGDLNTGIYSPAADQVGITVSGTQKVLVTNTQITFSGDVNIGDGIFNSDSDITVNSVDIGLGGGNQITNARFGVNALNANNIGQWNAAFGSECLVNNQAGGENVGVGFQALYTNLNGSSNTGLGAYALYSNINANSNTAIGYASLYDAVSAEGNVAIGGYSLGNTLASRNVGIGYEAGYTNTNGTYNVLAGYRAGYSLTTGNNNTIIGNIEGSAGLADTIIIGAGSAEKIKVDSSNNVFLTGTIKTISGGTTGVPIYTTSGDADTGISFPASNTIALSASGLGRVAVDINRVTVSGTFLATTISGTTFASTLGTTSAPAYSFSGDLNTGIYSPASDSVAITASGLTKLAVDINRTTVSGTFKADTVSGTVVTAALGSVTAPSFSFSGDLNTGLYSPSADVVAVTSSGLQVVRFQSDLSSTFAGSLQLPLGSAAAPALAPVGGTNTGIYYPDTSTVAVSTGGNERLRVDSSGRVLTGIQSARANFFNSTVTTGQHIEGTTNDNRFLSIVSSRAAQLGGGIILGSQTSGAAGGNTIVADGGELGIISFQGNDGAEFVEAARIESKVDAACSANDMPGRLAFYTTADGASSPTERMRIDSSGSVCIGRTIPRATLDVQGSDLGTTAGDISETLMAAASDGNTSRMAIVNYRINSATGHTNAEFRLQKYVDTAKLGFIGFRSASTTFGTGTNTVWATLTSAANFKIGGTDNRATTEGTNQLVLFNGTAPVGTLTNGVSLYSSAGELTALSASGSAVTLAPQIRTPLGSASTTAIAPAGGTNTGIFYPDTSTVAVSTAGSERLRVRNDGNIGVGGTGTNNISFRISKAIIGSTNAVGLEVNSQVDGAVTNRADAYTSVLSVASASQTLATMSHYRAFQSTIGATATVTNQYGFAVDSNLTGATNNYGFHSNIAAATGRWNFYAAGTAANYFAGNVGIGNATTPTTHLEVSSATGSASPTPTEIRISTTSTASDWSTTSPWGRLSFYSADGSEGGAKIQASLETISQSTNGGVSSLVFKSAAPSTGTLTERMRIDTAGRLLINSDTSYSQSNQTPSVQYHDTIANGFGAYRWSNDTGAPAFSLAKSRGAAIGTNTIVANGDALGALSFSGDDGTDLNNIAASVTAAVDGTPASNNMPGRLLFNTTPAGSNTPTERMRIDSSGNVGIGATPAAGNQLSVTAAFTGAVVSTGILSQGTVKSDVTTAGIGFRTFINTQATSFTLGSLTHFEANQGSIGAGSTVTSQYGFKVANNLIGATNNYGFHSSVGSGSNNWNFYAAGTAANYFAGATQTALGTAAAPSLTPIGGTDTGIFYPDTSTVAVSTDGSERLRVDSSGRVLIGTTARNTTHYASVGHMFLEGTGDATSSLVQTCWSTADTSQPWLILAKSGGASVGTRGIVANNELIGTISFEGDDGTNFIRAAQIGATVDGAPSTNDMPGALRFLTTADGASGPTERMRIDSSGTALFNLSAAYAVEGFNRSHYFANPAATNCHVVIGAANTGFPSLYFTKTRGTTPSSSTTVANGDVLGDLRFFGSDGTDLGSSGGRIGCIVDGTPGSNSMPGRLIFATTPSGSDASLERMRITSTGNVKIGGSSSRATTEGSAQLVLFDGTAPVGTLANGVSLYSASGECRVMDAAGASTLLSPHDDDGYWVFDSTDTRNNRRLLVHMEKLAKWIDENFGTSFVEEFGGPPVPN